MTSRNGTRHRCSGDLTSRKSERRSRWRARSDVRRLTCCARHRAAAAGDRRETRQQRRRVLHVPLLGDDVLELVDEVVEIPAGAVEQGVERRRSAGACGRGERDRRAADRQRARATARKRTRMQRAVRALYCRLRKEILHAATRASDRPRRPRHRARSGARPARLADVRRSGATAQARAQAPAVYFPERLDWQHKKPEDVGMNPALVNEAVQIAVAAETQGPKDLTLFLPQQLRQGAVQHHRRSGEGSRRRERHHHAQRLHRRRVGRPEARRHDQQRHEDVPDDGRRAGVAARADSRRQRLRARLHAAARRSVRVASTTRRSSGITCCARRATGRARCGASRTGPIGRWAKSRRTGRTGKLWEPGTHFKYNDVRVNVMALAALQVWRRAAARRAARGSDGSDRRLVHVALVRLRQLVGRDRRPEDAVGERRRPLGRRHVHQRVRHGALRLSVPAQRQVEGPPDRVREVDPDGAHAGERQRRPTATRTGT